MSPIIAEAIWLAAVGTLAGLALAWAGIRELRSLAPADLPRLDTITIDTSVLAFTALAGLAGAILFGMTPALRASRPRLMNVLRGISRNTGLGTGSGMRSAVVTAEVALSFVLLVGSGLMFRSPSTCSVSIPALIRATSSPLSSTAITAPLRRRPMQHSLARWRSGQVPSRE